MITCQMEDCIFIHENKQQCDKEDIEIGMNIEVRPECFDYTIEEESEIR